MTNSLPPGIGIRGVASAAMLIEGRKAARRVGAVGAVKAVRAVREVGEVEAVGFVVVERGVEAVDGIAWREVGWFAVVEY